MAQAVNVTKYAAGGSGNNYIPGGYIKSVEQIWLDSYVINFTNTNTTIDIAIVGQNKKITGIEAVIVTTASQTNGTVSIGYSSDANVDSFLAPTTITHNLTVSSIGLPNPGFIMASGPATPTSGTNVVIAVMVAAGLQKVTTGTQTTISLKLNNWTPTSGTIYTTVRYTN